MTSRTSPPDDVVARLTADTEPYLSCDECFARLDQYVERRIQDTHYDDPPRRAHLTGCGACAEEAETLLDLLTEDAR